MTRGRSLHWERGLKLGKPARPTVAPCRSLHWERGLKLYTDLTHQTVDWSLPSLGAWIETPQRDLHRCRSTKSLPSLGAWIETAISFADILSSPVAPFIGSVD